MRAEDGERDVNAPSITRTPRFLTWLQGILVLLGVSSILATKFLPRATGKVVSSVLLDAMVIVFIIALPILEVIIWRLLRQLPARGRWGLMLIVVGLGIGVPVGAVMVFATIFLPTLSPPNLINVMLLVVLCGAFASMVLGLLLVFVGVIRESVQLLRNRRQARTGDGR